ncbi:MAG: hypothetical protein E7597_06730 [Ruminococcaceae bacterium]|nr:hypothetical protein [Oscillospiraceae bacterium]
MNKASAILRVLAAVFACLFVVLAFIGLAVRMCFLDKYRYEDSILTDEFYEEIKKARSNNLQSLGTMVEVDEAVFDRYASVDDCNRMGESYVRALVSDMLEGTDAAGKIHFSSPELLSYLKADYAGYDFSQAGFDSSDAAAEAAYTMICDQIDTAVLFVPEKISRNLDIVSRLFGLVSDISFFWFVPLLLAVFLYGAVIFAGGNRKNNMFGAAASFWCAAVLCFVPVLVLYIGTDTRYLDFDRNVLYTFLSGCVNAVRGASMLLASLFFVVASGFVAVTGIIATGARSISVPAPTVAEDVYDRP